MSVDAVAVVALVVAACRGRDRHMHIDSDIKYDALTYFDFPISIACSLPLVLPLSLFVSPSLPLCTPCVEYMI